MQKFQSYRFDVMTKGSGDARMQPLYFLITTAGTDTNSICYETHQKAKDILEGRVCYGGLDRAIRCGNVNTESVYDNRGILFI